MKAALGLVRRTDCWRLTWRGWLLSALLLGGVALAAIRAIYPFLAVTAKVQGEVLVVEGWIPDGNIQAIREEFAAGNYPLLITTGTVIPNGELLSQFKTYAELEAANLAKNGFDAARIVAVPGREVIRDRTYASAVALREWLEKNQPGISKLNLFTRGAHARRSRLLFEKAFAGTVEIGVIAADDRRYDVTRWWESSEGFREVTAEAIAYFYARFLFHPASN